MNPVELSPPIHNFYELVFALVFLGIQAWQFYVLHCIKRNTNGLVAEKIAAAASAARSEGLREGALSERARAGKDDPAR